MAPAPREHAKLLYKAILRTNCLWWCQGRWWAQRLQLHPTYGAACRAISLATDAKLTWSDHLANSFQLHLSTLGLSLLDHNPSKGLKVQLQPTNDYRKTQALADVVDEQGHFWTGGVDEDASMHAIRIIARIDLLSTVIKSRSDTEGLNTIDVQAQSHKAWKRFVHDLSDSDRKLLDIWRCGATSTPTRMGGRLGDPQMCKWCYDPYPSTHHYWAHCGHYDTLRENLRQGDEPHLFTLQDYIPADWWTQQPRVTSKSGWICHTAHANPDTRAKLQVMTCKLALAIMADLAWY